MADGQIMQAKDVLIVSGNPLSNCKFSCMSERWIPNVMRKACCLKNVTDILDLIVVNLAFVLEECPKSGSEGSSDACDLNRVSEAIVDMIVCRERMNLSFAS